MLAYKYKLNSLLGINHNLEILKAYRVNIYINTILCFVETICQTPSSIYLKSLFHNKQLKG